MKGYLAALLIPVLVVSQIASANLCGPVSSIFPYLGNKNEEAVMVFDAHVRFRTIDTVAPEPTQAQMRAAVESQIKYLHGPMKNGQKFESAPKKNPLIGIRGVRLIAQANGKKTWEVSYSYQGNVVIREGVSSFYQLPLPVMPETFYSTTVSRSSRDVPGNACTSSEYPLENMLWYFWSPARADCGLREGTDYQSFNARIISKAKPKQVSPRYEELVTTDGKIHMYVVFGMVKYSRNGNPDNGNDDAGAFEYQLFRKDSQAIGFRSLGKISSSLNESTTEILVKSTSRGSIFIHLYYGPTSLVDSGVRNLHLFLQQGLSSRGVVMYNGHSGSGYSLSLDAIRRTTGVNIEMNAKEYNVLLLNGCSTYSYYGDHFFKKKAEKTGGRATGNLEIITNGIEGNPYDTARVSSAMVKAVDGWATGKAISTYGQILEEIGPDSMPGMIGTEDYPK